MNLEFDATFRVKLPETTNINAQNLFMFNMYRSGSSVIESVSETLAKASNRTGLNLTRICFSNGVELFDSRDFRKNSIFLQHDGAQLVKLCDFGGYVLFGFREVPFGFAEHFSHIGASLLVVRDPRDIGISHYYSVQNHATKNAVEKSHILELRDITARMSLEEYILSDDTIAFIRRTVLCYKSMISRGLTVWKYEDFCPSGRLDIRLFSEALLGYFKSYILPDWTVDKFSNNAKMRIANSKSLQGHSSTAAIRSYNDLAAPVRAAYTAKLEDALALLNYGTD